MAAGRVPAHCCAGLNRSTVAALVAELRELGLAFESEPGQTNLVGRPSPTVHPDPRTLAIAVNPEVDAVTVGLVSLAGKVVKRVRVDTDAPPTVDEAIAITSDVVARLQSENLSNRIVGIGVAVPGMVRAGDGLVRLAPHLNWIDEPFATLLSDATGLPVQAGNDASLGAMAERMFGAGRGMTDLIYLNGGASGIGGGIIASGVALGGAEGYAGEFGHIRVNSSVGSYVDGLVGDRLLEKASSRSAKVIASICGIASIGNPEISGSSPSGTIECTMLSA